MLPALVLTLEGFTALIEDAVANRIELYARYHPLNKTN